MAAILGAVICFCLRLFAIRRGWQLPVAHASPEENENNVDEADRNEDISLRNSVRSIENGEAYACHFLRARQPDERIGA